MEFDWSLGWPPSIASSTSSKALSTMPQLRSRADMAVSVADISPTPKYQLSYGINLQGTGRIVQRNGPAWLLGTIRSKDYKRERE